MRGVCPKDSEKKYLALETIAEMENLSLPNLIDYCRRGRLEARELGGQWFVSEADLAKCRELGRESTIDFRHPRLLPMIRLALGLLLVLFVQSLSVSNIRQYLFIGERIAVEKLSRSIATLSKPNLQANTATALIEVDGALKRFWLGLIDFWQTLSINSRLVIDKILAGWKNFLGAKTAPVPTPAPAAGNPAAGQILDAAMIAQLKSEIKAELEKELLNRPASGNLPGTGLVVLPSSGDPIKDRAAALELSRSFSDQVEIRFEASGQTGVITPVFRSGRGDDYLFIITPIKKTAP